MITQKYLPTNTLRRSGQKILGVKFLVAHDTGNPGSTALNNVDYYIKSANEMESSAHAFVDDLGVIECIPFSEKAWHVRRNVNTDNALFGVDANDYALGIELCFFPADITRSKQAYKNYVEYIKSICVSYNINPATHIKGHFQLDSERRADPINAFKYIGKNWEDFIKDVAPTSPAPAVFTPDQKVKIKEAILLLQSLL